jgi:hypothetical protein
MFRFLIIWVSLVWLVNISAQQFGDNFKLSYPSLVHQNRTFEVSIITSNDLIKSNKLDLYIIPDRGIKLEAVIMRTENDEKNVKFSSASTEGYLYDAKMCSIKLNEPNPAQNDSYFQILMRFRAETVDYSEIEFYGEFRRNNKIIDYLESSKEDLYSSYPNHYRIKIDFYKTTVVGERTVILRPQSYFSITPDLKFKNDLLLEFWFKQDKVRSPFFEIMNKHTNLSEYQLVTNQYQILICESDFHTEYSISPYFVSNNNWQHIEIIFSLKDREVRFYCNGYEFSGYDLPPSIDLTELKFSFIGPKQGNIYIDQIRFVDLNGSLGTVLRNRTFSSFISDSSKVLMQLNLDEQSTSDLSNYDFLTMNNISLTSSDAPIFNRAPELNITPMSNYYELTWSGGDYKNVSTYSVERAEGENSFVNIYKIDADNSENKEYSYLSKNNENSEVVYFRVKQVNKDGSVTYSSQVKVGQGKMEEFVLGQNYPNPFNPVTQISVDVLEEADFHIVVYNLEGQKVADLYHGVLSQGEHNFKFDGSELPSGIYLYKVSTSNFNQTKKMILAK